MAALRASIGLLSSEIKVAPSSRRLSWGRPARTAREHMPSELQRFLYIANVSSHLE